MPRFTPNDNAGHRNTPKGNQPAARQETESKSRCAKHLQRTLNAATSVLKQQMGNNYQEYGELIHG